MSDINKDNRADCSLCCFYEVCDHCPDCEYYDTIDEEEENEAMERYIEEERINFYHEWFRYIEES